MISACEEDSGYGVIARPVARTSIAPAIGRCRHAGAELRSLEQVDRALVSLDQHLVLFRVPLACLTNGDVVDLAFALGPGNADHVVGGAGFIQGLHAPGWECAFRDRSAEFLLDGWRLLGGFQC